MFVEDLTSELQQQNFTLLVTGFCRKFSTLIEQCSKEDKKVSKAVLECSWMKVMSNFQCGKATQERMIFERCLVNAPPATTEDIHCVISLIHELVYHVIHDHICSSKADQCSPEPSTSSLTKESDDTLYRYCGDALQRMVKLRRETLEGKKKRAKPSETRKITMARVFEGLILIDKSNISPHLKNLDEGNLTFPRHELL